MGQIIPVVSQTGIKKNVQVLIRQVFSGARRPGKYRKLNSTHRHTDRRGVSYKHKLIGETGVCIHLSKPKLKAGEIRIQVNFER